MVGCGHRQINKDYSNIDKNMVVLIRLKEGRIRSDADVMPILGLQLLTLFIISLFIYLDKLFSLFNVRK